MSKQPKAPKLVLSKETLKKLAEKTAPQAGSAHPTTTVNTIKTGCC